MFTVDDFTELLKNQFPIRLFKQFLHKDKF